MTLLFVDGFDLLQTSDLALKWSTLQNNPANGGTVTTGGRVSGNKFHCNADITFNASTQSGALAFVHPAKTTVILGFACQFFGGVATHNQMCFFMDTAGAVQGMLNFNTTTNVIDIYRGNGSTLLTSTSAIISQNVFNYIEVSWTVSTTVGAITVQQNGIVVATYSGNTQQTANNNIGQTWIGQFGGMSIGNTTAHFNYRIDFDDVYICDTLGTQNNAFLGDVRVTGLLPNGAGTNTNMAHFGSAATNWQSVNQNPQDGDTTYVATSVVGTADTYLYNSLPADAATVFAVVGEHVSRKDDAGTCRITTHVRSGGGEADSPTSTLAGPSYAIPEQIMEFNPVSITAWTPTTVNSMEIGPKLQIAPVVTSATLGATVTVTTSP